MVQFQGDFWRETNTVLLFVCLLLYINCALTCKSPNSEKLGQKADFLDFAASELRQLCFNIAIQQLADT